MSLSPRISKAFLTVDDKRLWRRIAAHSFPELIVMREKLKAAKPSFQSLVKQCCLLRIPPKEIPRRYIRDLLWTFKMTVKTRINSSGAAESGGARARVRCTECGKHVEGEEDDELLSETITFACYPTKGLKFRIPAEQGAKLKAATVDKSAHVCGRETLTLCGKDGAIATSNVPGQLGSSEEREEREGYIVYTNTSLNQYFDSNEPHLRIESESSIEVMYGCQGIDIEYGVWEPCSTNVGHVNAWVKSQRFVCP